MKTNLFSSLVDACVYFGRSILAVILIWVDNIIITVKTIEIMNKIKEFLKNKFKMKDMGKISYFLGIHFQQFEDKIKMDQSQYLESILVKYGMTDSKPQRSTPCERIPSVPPESNVIDNPRKYREIVGSLIYAMTCTLPDLSWVVSKLSQHLAEPEVDWVILKHALRYIKGTLDYKLCFTKTVNDLMLIGFSDSDWASSPDRRSTSGYYFSLNENGAPISWKTRKQQTVALSSCEAEYMALAMSTQEAIYLKIVMAGFGVLCNPVILYSGSQSALSLAQNPINHSRSKHIDIKYHFIREKSINGVVDFRYVSTDKNVADSMTKPMPKQKLLYFFRYLFGD